MRKIFLLIMFLFAFSSQILAGEIVVRIKGLVCSFCAYSIQKVMKKDNRIEKTTVDFENKTVTLHTKEKMSDAEVKEKIKDAGYNVESIVRKK